MSARRLHLLTPCITVTSEGKTQTYYLSQGYYYVGNFEKMKDGIFTHGTTPESHRATIKVLEYAALIKSENDFQVPLNSTFLTDKWYSLKNGDVFEIDGATVKYREFFN